ncbi:hypothetical protein [Jiangella asiatica]|uniref:Uncharacterized protein n=1 Tax=Jiangella asiatica TaxID=2530372 RepID=A0A4R5CN85_9ACTN|nr:hypothetical protein [Jiangella asiatica]TDD99012.1 hypothetical protein E1269_27645 [Jiangella asiatica]
MTEQPLPRVTHSPHYRHAAYGGESVALHAGAMRVDVHRRTTGWGWAELTGPDGTVLAVLDHLGEVSLRDSPVPVRLEADAVRREGDHRLVFDVRARVVAEALRDTSFARWIGSPFAGPALTGRVSLSADPDGARLRLEYELRSEADLYVRYLRGPWLRVGEGSFGAERDDAILPGVEWALGEEWTSGTDWFRDPWAMRVTPHRNTVAVPVMAVSRGGWAVALSWRPDQDCTGWFSMPREHPQPVFAAPNVVERRAGSLLGLMLPEARDLGGDHWHADPPLELHKGQQIALTAEVSVVAGRSLDAVVDWVRRHGLPKPPAPRWPAEETLHRIAEAFTTRLWHDGRGYGTAQFDGDAFRAEPAFARGYLARFPDSPHADRLAEQIASLVPAEIADDTAALQAEGDELLAAQRPDGSFAFDPEGRHRTKDDFLVARDLVAPMGVAGDTALGLSMKPAIRLFELFTATADTRYAAAARRALDACLDLHRPEGGDYWETPLHAPNLLAAGHAAVAYELGHRAFGDPRYRERTAHWLRTLLAFTHLWEPPGLPMTYNTKPCLCSSDWYFANWVRDHVQWEVLTTFALAAGHGLDLAAADPEIDWRRYQEGVTWAAVRWLLEHRDDTWRPHNLPDSLRLYREGRFDLCLPDTHNATTGLYGGMAIMPDTVAVNLLDLLPKGSDPDPRPTARRPQPFDPTPAHHSDPR